MQLVQADISLMTNYVSTENWSRKLDTTTAKLILNTEQNSLFIPVAKLAIISLLFTYSLLELFITHYIYRVIICYAYILLHFKYFFYYLLISFFSRHMLELRFANTEQQKAVLTGSRLLSCCQSGLWCLDHQLKY